MNILLVEDNYEKVQAIHALFKEHHFVNMVTCRSIRDAIDYLSNQCFHLVVIDLQIPDLEGGEPSEDGGARLLATIETEGLVNIPGYILGLTSHIQEVEKYKNLFNNFGWEIYHSENQIWKTVIKNKVQSISCNQRHKIVDLAILTALEHTELEAVLSLDVKWTNDFIDNHEYHFGEFSLPSGRKISVVAASSERMGVSSAASLTTRVGIKFKPKLMIMSGICAGVSGKCNLGDVIIGDPIWDWGAGKLVSNEGTKQFQPDPHQLALPMSLKRAATQLSRSTDFLKSLAVTWREDDIVRTPLISTGPMACGSQVIANKNIITEIQENHRKLLAIEMESYGFQFSCQSLNIPSIVMKSVCDFADEHKADDLQKYAAYTSANSALEFAKKYFSN